MPLGERHYLTYTGRHGEPLCQTPGQVVVTPDPARVTCTRCLRRMRTLPTPEKVFLNQVRALAKRLGFLTYHTHDSRKSEPGFPDLVLVKPPRLIFAELKRDGQRPTLIQDVWLQALVKIPATEVYCWHSSDLPLVATILKGSQK